MTATPYFINLLDRARPISFTPAHVTAVGLGDKTKSRRIVRDQPGEETKETTVWVEESGQVRFVQTGTDQPASWTTKSPYGRIGDYLWIREEHTIRVSQVKGQEVWTCTFRDGQTIEHRAHELPVSVRTNLGRRRTLGNWSPSRHLPKVFARQLLQLTDQGVERLQAITEEDARAEGVRAAAGLTARQAYQAVWRHLHGAGSWQTNPYVRVLSFRPVRAGENHPHFGKQPPA